MTSQPNMRADGCGCFYLFHRRLFALVVMVLGCLQFFASTTCSGYSSVVVPPRTAVTTHPRAPGRMMIFHRPELYVPGNPAPCAGRRWSFEGSYFRQQEQRTRVRVHGLDPPAGERDAPARGDRSAFLRNIKSKLSFPLEGFDRLRRRRRRPMTNRERLASALRAISRWVSFPYRWLRRQYRPRRRPRQKGEEAPPPPPTSVHQSAVAQEVAGEASERVVASKEGASAAAATATATPPLVAELPGRQESSRLARQLSKTIDGERWAVASVDLSGQWEILVTDEFKHQYDTYLTLLGQPLLVRSVALSIVGLTTEETIQKDDGRELFIRGRNVRGCWERSLLASGADEQSASYEPAFLPIVTADDETVYSEAWWERNGTVHRSWLRGVQKYGGGDFESLRYLDGDVLVCQSTFHPNDATREKASVTWRFKRQRGPP